MYPGSQFADFTVSAAAGFIPSCPIVYRLTTEGIPVSLVEALSYGIPIIATDVGGNSEVCDSQVGILLSSDPSAEEVKESIEDFLSLEHTKRDEIRKKP